MDLTPPPAVLTSHAGKTTKGGSADSKKTVFSEVTLLLR